MKANPNRQPRSIRMAETIRRMVADLCLVDAVNPLIRGATITHVVVAKDLSHARIYVVHSGKKEEKVMQAFEKFAPRLRFLIAQSWVLKKLPRLAFEYDHVAMEAKKIRALLHDDA